MFLSCKINKKVINDDAFGRNFFYKCEDFCDFSRKM